MTAEIAILNKTAVALAADSAVTAEMPGGRKIFNSVNKLFGFSATKPIGLMIFGNSTFIGVPWETIVKIYRKDVDQKSFPTLQGYAKDFVSWLDRPNSIIFPEEYQRRYVQETVFTYFNDVIQNVFRARKSSLPRNIAMGNFRANMSLLSERLSVQELKTELEVQKNTWAKSDRIDSMPVDFSDQLKQRYALIFSELKSELAVVVDLDSTVLDLVDHLSCTLFSHARFSNRRKSGIVIAGFGDDEIFPSFVEYTIEGMSCDRLKYREEKSQTVTMDMYASIAPFAQRDVVQGFIEGQSPEFEQHARNFWQSALNQFAETILNAVPNMNSQERQAALAALAQPMDGIVGDFERSVQQLSQKQYIRPIIEAASILPKDEMAALAESLIHLTALRRRISTDAETVGGPIDVAVISKGDGFVWIRRKHYFNPSINPHFVANFYNK